MATPPKTLTLDIILAYQPKSKTVDIPSLGGKVTVREALVSDQEYVVGKIDDDSTMIDAQVWMVIRCTISPKFEESHFKQLKQLPATTLAELDAAIEEAAEGKAVSAKAAEKSDLA